jgi:hypothetical protein
MKSLKASGSYYGLFTITVTGEATDADTLPSATATKNGVDDGDFTLTCAKIDTGRYKITGTVPAYDDGDLVQVSVAATVNSVATKGVVDEFVVVSVRPGIDIADLIVALLVYDWESIVAVYPDFCVLNALRVLRNAHGPAVDDVVPFYEEDGETVAFEMDVTSSASAEVVTSQTPHVAE